VKRPAGMLGQPFLYLGMFVGRVVVDAAGFGNKYCPETGSKYYLVAPWLYIDKGLTS